MNNTEPTLSLSTLVEVSDLMGFPLGRNSSIKNSQEFFIITGLQSVSTISMPQEQRRQFFFATLDFLIEDIDGKKEFNFIELSGTGSAGISNVTNFAFNSILKELTRSIEYIQAELPLILIAYTDSQSLSSSLPRKFIYERFFYAESFKNGFREKFNSPQIVTLPEIEKSKSFDVKQPTIVIGFLWDLLKYIYTDNKNLLFFNHPISAIFNDSMSNVISKLYHDKSDLNSIFFINNIYELSADKSLAYNLYNKFIETQSYVHINKPINFTKVFNREDLIERVLGNIDSNNKIVIKPYGGTVNVGIEFFLNPEPVESVIRRIDRSIKATETFHSLDNYTFPYVITDYIDYTKIDKSDHYLYNHKYELRMIVYRQNDQLKAFPLVVRVAGTPFDPDNFDPLMLFSHSSIPESITSEAKHKYLLPLANKTTLDIIGLKIEELEELCTFSTNFMNFCIKNKSAGNFRA